MSLYESMRLKSFENNLFRLNMLIQSYHLIKNRKGVAPDLSGIFRVKVLIKIIEYNENKMVQPKDIDNQSK